MFGWGLNLAHVHALYWFQGGAEPLHIAARCGRLDIVQLLIEKYKVSPDTLTEVSSRDRIQS